MAQSPSAAVKLFGTDEPVPDRPILRAGPLSAELDAGNLRYIRLNGREALRAISFIVRDRDWGTYGPAIENLAIDQTDEGFTVSYDATCRDDNQAFRYSARIAGRPDGSLSFDAEGKAVTDFLTNRTGFVVLHGVEGVAGEPVEVLHTDGTVEQAKFPALIDPVQPFMDIRALTHRPLPGIAVTCRMEGDAFEMEDQRNWTDASYKTYVRPLAKPWPYTLKAGEEVKQSVTLTVEGDLAPATAAADTPPVTVRVGGADGTMPAIGLGVPGRHAAAAVQVADLVRQAWPGLLICEFDARQGHDAATMEHHKTLGEATGADLVLEAVLPGQTQRDGKLVFTASPDVLKADLDFVRTAAAEAGVRFAAVTLFPAADQGSTLPGSVWPEAAPLEDIYRAGRVAFPGVPIGGGMYSYFTELNRKRPPAEALDFVTHTTCPIVHAGDDVSVMESLEALPSIIASTRAFIAGKPYRVGPSAIGMRQNPYGAAPMDNPSNGRRAMAYQDPRQRGLLGAAWNLGYVAHMARGGVDVVTLSAPVGEFGIVHAKMSYAQPWFDREGGVYPVYHVIAGLAAGAGHTRRATESTAPGVVQPVAHDGPKGTVLWLANLTGQRQQVAVDGLGGREGRIAVLDETTFETAMRGPNGFAVSSDIDLGSVTLGPYAVARIDIPS